VFVAATGNSQVEFLKHLAAAPGIEWGRTTMFHLDEYIGIPADHPASFRRYLRERFLGRVPVGTVHLVAGDAPDLAAELVRLNDLIRRAAVDVAFIGIGENGHIAFNDPPADFATETPFIVVDLDEACRRQQVGEGWFPSMAAVPRQAVSMSVRQILRAARIVCTVPDARKAQAVKTRRRRRDRAAGARLDPADPRGLPDVSRSRGCGAVEPVRHNQGTEGTKGTKGTITKLVGFPLWALKSLESLSRIGPLPNTKHKTPKHPSHRSPT